MEFNDLRGKTIKDIRQRKHSRFDDECYLDIKFTDGTRVTIVGEYGDYTGNSFGEYTMRIRLEDYGYEHGDNEGIWRWGI